MPSGQAGAVRLVLDTNVVVSGLLWKGGPARLMALAMSDTERVDLVSSPALLAEFNDVLSRGKFRKQLESRAVTPASVMAAYVQVVDLVHAPPLEAPVCSDPDDDVVLSTALNGEAHLIVSGDEHLLSLGSFHGIAIVQVAEALARLTPPELG